MKQKMMFWSCCVEQTASSVQPASEALPAAAAVAAAAAAAAEVAHQRARFSPDNLRKSEARWNSLLLAAAAAAAAAAACL
jgi:hypothetical protein